MKAKIILEINNKLYEAISHQPFEIDVCLQCDLYKDCAEQVPCFCSELVGMNYYFKEIKHVQNNLQSRSADHER